MSLTTQLFLLFVFVLTCLYSQSANITFQVTTADTLPLDEYVYISGNQPQLGGWDPGKVALTRDAPNLWGIEISFLQLTSIEFKFTRGSWATEEVLSDGTIPGNKHLVVKGDTTIYHTIVAWKDQFVQSGITGEVRYHRDFYSPQLDNWRDIVVWLPPSYADSADKRYSVLYMHDGQNIVDPFTSFMGKDWRVDEVADSLIRSGEIEEIIVVGIYNTKDREAEYSPVKKGRLYSRFLVETVKPFIDGNYRTKPDRENTAVMGASMGGIISFHLAWEYDHIFSKAACLSPAFLVDRREIVKRVRRYRGEKKDIKLYIDNGTVGLERKLYPSVKKMVRALKRRGFKEGEDLVVVIEEGAEHNEMAWARRIYVPLKLFFRTHPLSPSLSKRGGITE